MSDEEEFEFFYEDEVPLELIPKELHSFTEEGPFTRCVDCDTELYESGANYMIQKSMHRGEVIFEFALCMECHENLVRGFSKETTQRLMAHFEKFGNELPTMNACIDCGKPRLDLSSYNIAANCLGPFFESAFLICNDCQEHIQPLISEKTRRSRDGWVGRNFPCAPESRDLVPDSPLMF
jgi:uncharacterized protein with PIN domain